MQARPKFAAFFESDMFWARVALAAIVILALAVRLYGVDFGIPYLRHADEPVNYNVVIGMLERGDINPRIFNYPALSLYMYLLVAKTASIVGHISGVYEAGSGIEKIEFLAFGVARIPNPNVFLAMRLASVAAGCATVIMVYLCGREAAPASAAGIWTGLLAALFTAVSPTMVEHSRYIGPDMWQALFILMSVWASLKVMRHDVARYYLAAGIAAGLAAGTKYVGGLVLLTLPVAHIMRNIGWPSFPLAWKQFDPGPLFPRAVLLSLFVFMITTPHVILDYPTVAFGFLRVAATYATGQAGMEGDTLFYYLRLVGSTEGLPAVLAVAGLAYGIVQRRQWVVVASAFPILYFVMIVSMPVRNARTFLPLLPLMFLLSADFLISLTLRFATLGPAVMRRALLAIACVGLVAPPAMATMAAVSGLTAMSTRDVAREWIAENLPPGSRIIIENYSPYVDPDRFAVVGTEAMIFQDTGPLLANGYDYLVFSAQMYGRYVHHPDRYPDHAAVYARFFEKHELVKSFGDGGTEVRIYRLPDQPAS